MGAVQRFKVIAQIKVVLRGNDLFLGVNDDLTDVPYMYHPTSYDIKVTCPLKSAYPFSRINTILSAVSLVTLTELTISMKMTSEIETIEWIILFNDSMTGMKSHSSGQINLSVLTKEAMVDLNLMTKLFTVPERRDKPPKTVLLHKNNKTCALKSTIMQTVISVKILSSLTVSLTCVWLLICSMTGYAAPCPSTFMIVICKQILANTLPAGGQQTSVQCLVLLMKSIEVVQNKPAKGLTIAILMNRHVRTQLNVLNYVYVVPDLCAMAMVIVLLILAVLIASKSIMCSNLWR